jgi:small subunit ribosomal protein S3
VYKGDTLGRGEAPVVAEQEKRGKKSGVKHAAAS